MPTRPAVFLDRDGTLTEERSYLTRPDQIRLLPGAAEAIRLLRQNHFACTLVTNQSAVGRGLISEPELHRIHDELVRQLLAEGAALDGIYFCPAASNAGTPDRPERKPAPGMLLRAARELHIDLAQSWMVGDSARDILAGQKAGCRGCILVRTGHDVADALPQLRDSDHVAADITEAARLILTVT